jgi:hypothetical protein
MAQAVKRTDPSGWVGWIYFAGALMLAVGGMQVISGLVALFKDDYYAVTNAGLVVFSYTTWGWANLILGILVMLAGIGLWSGSMWARIVGVFLAVLVMLDNIAFMSAYPLWSIVGLIISGFIIYALTMHGGELKSR